MLQLGFTITEFDRQENSLFEMFFEEDFSLAQAAQFFEYSKSKGFDPI